jgi:Family of unknown function (DUF6262)
MSKDSRIATLNTVAESRKQDCLERTEKAITKLLKNQEKISFGSIARVACVSVSYLYKYPEIKERIQNLRQQQTRSIVQPPKYQTASEKSKQAIIEQFRNRIKILERERQEQVKQIQALTGRLYEVGQNQDLIEHFKVENSRLNEENKQLHLLLDSIRNDSQPQINNITQINSLELETNHHSRGIISDDLSQIISEIGIRLNKDLTQLIKSKSELEVKNALLVVKESLALGNVRSKAGLFRKALENNWQPDESDQERKINTIKSAFSLWYDIAYSYGIVIGYREEEGTIMVQENTGKWNNFDDFSAKWTLEYLKRWQSSNKKH